MKCMVLVNRRINFQILGVKALKPIPINFVTSNKFISLTSTCKIRWGLLTPLWTSQPQTLWNTTPGEKCFRGVARIFPWGGPKYHIQNFSKCNLGEYPLPPGDESSPGGVGKLPKRVCAAQLGHDLESFCYCETRYVVLRLNLSSKTLK